MENKPQKIKYFLYARRSIEKKDDEERILSVESQIKEMRELAGHEKLQIVRIFEETKSAKHPGRPVFGEMIARIKNGEANGILCWKMDRLSRNPIDEGTIKYILRESVVQHIRALDRSWYPSDNSLIASVEFGCSEQQSRDISAHVTRGLRGKADAGARPCIAPIGYKNSKYHIKGHEEILVDEERFDLVRKLFDAALMGQYSALKLRDIATDKLRLRTRKNKKISRSYIYSILSNPFYYGTFEYPKGSGNWYAGSHKPMINKEEYDLVQHFLGKKGQPRPKSHIFAYTGLMRCGECGAQITAEEKWKHQKNGVVRHYIYYHCTKRINPKCTQRSIEEKALENEIENFLSKIEIPPEFHEWVIEELKKTHSVEKKDRNTLLHKHQVEYIQCVEKLDSLLDLRLKNEISEEMFAEKKSKMEQNKIQLKQSLSNIDKRVDDWIKAAEQTLAFAEKAKTEFLAGDLDKRKQILAVIGSNRILKDKKLFIQAEKPLLILQEAASEINGLNQMLEPAKNGINKRQIKEAYAKSTLLCTLVDQVRTSIKALTDYSVFNIVASW